MARAFSDDLRCRILETYGRGGMSLRALAERFAVSWDYAKKIRRQQLRTGQMERVRQSHHGPVSRVTAEVQAQVRAQARAQPDLTLAELQQRLRQQTRVGLSQSLLWLWLQRLGLRVKKSRSTPRSKTRRKGGGGARRGGSR